MRIKEEKICGFTDIHHHIIYGLDEDGPQSFQDTCAMLRAAQADGIARIVATPHVTPGIHPFLYEDFLIRLQEANDYCQQEGISIEILPGSEVLYTQMTVQYLRDKRIPTLARTSYVLVEFPSEVAYSTLANALDELLQSGFIPILAHVERYKCLVFHPRRALFLRTNMNVLLQINCSALLKKEGFVVRHFCRRLLGRGAIDWVASDAHNTSKRSTSLKKTFEVLVRQYGREYAEALMGWNGISFILAENA